MTTDTDSRVILYGDGLFQSTTTLSYAEQLMQLVAAPFNTVVLWAVHVKPGGDVYYNNTLAVSGGEIQPELNPQLPDLLAASRAGGVTTVLASLGPFVSDYTSIIESPEQALANLQALVSYLSIDAIDLDYEPPTYDEQDIVNVTDVTYWVRKFAGVTYCPYEKPDFWIECMSRVYNDASYQPVLWFNLQCYDGGGGNVPSQWIDALAAAADQIGIPASAAPAFVVPGYWVQNTGPKAPSWGRCPSQIQTDFAVLTEQGIGSGFLWNSADIFANEAQPLCGDQDVTPAGYANAIIAGLDG